MSKKINIKYGLYLKSIIAKIVFSTFVLFVATVGFGVDFSASEIAKEGVAPKPIDKEPKKKIPIPLIPQKNEPTQTYDEAKINVKGFVFEGNAIIKTDELTALLSYFTQKELTVSQIYEAAGKVTAMYEKKGYFAAKAYIPEQEIENGSVKIKIVEAKYGNINIKNDSLVRDMISVSVAEKLKKERVLSTQGLERTLMLLNETPGIKVESVSVKEGVKPEESDIDINLSKTDRLSGYAMYDNYGGKYIGKNRLSLTASVDSPTSRGDKLAISGLTSEGGLIKNYTLGYDIPLGYDGLKATVGYSSVSYKLSGEYTELNAVGTSESVNIGASYPFVKTVETELVGNLSMDFKKLKDEIKNLDQSTRKKGASTTASIAYLKKINDFDISASLAVTGGKLFFDDIEAKESDDNGAATGGLYAKTNVAVSLGYRYTNTSTVTLSLKGQKALSNHNLDGGDDFLMSGSSAARAYPSGEYSTENGYLATLSSDTYMGELFSIGYRLGVFVDYARGYPQNNFAAEKSKTLADAGISVLGYFKDTFFKLEIAKIIGSEKVTAEYPSNYRALFLLGYKI